MGKFERKFEVNGQGHREW